MKILVLNDDGIFAPGISKCVSALSGHEVFVVAPESEMSAISGALTVRRPLCYKPVDFVGSSGAFSCDGTPVDCAKLAIGKLIPWRPDAVVSGFNHGINVGQDVFYSGTIAAAMEGLYCGIPSVAVSLARSCEGSFAQSQRTAASVLPVMLDILLRWSGRREYLLSINVPSNENPPIVITSHGKASFSYWHEQHVDGPSNSCWLRGEPLNGDPHDHTDAYAVGDGCVSITPLRPSLSDNHLDTRQVLAELVGLVNQYFPGIK